MRTIKFRAWIKDEDVPMGNMVNPMDNLYVNLRTGKTYIEDSRGKLIEETGAILMQYTGLHDKNGKEIYEGDIVRTIGQDNEIMIGIVEWHKQCVSALVCRYLINDDGFGDYNWDWLNDIDIEIIGNKFENKKLLK